MLYPVTIISALWADAGWLTRQKGRERALPQRQSGGLTPARNQALASLLLSPLHPVVGWRRELEGQKPEKLEVIDKVRLSEGKKKQALQWCCITRTGSQPHAGWISDFCRRA